MTWTHIQPQPEKEFNGLNKKISQEKNTAMGIDYRL